MFLKPKGCLVLLLILQTALGYAQLQPKFPNGMPSANASCFDVFSATPVSQFTGVPDISIPLLTVNSGNLSIPITLSYHANGVAPDVHPGWVGLGWSLFSGGMITSANRASLVGVANQTTGGRLRIKQSGQLDKCRTC
jgi:hypothetical protein